MIEEDWKNQYRAWKNLTPSQLKILDDGAKSLSQTWLLNAMWSEWKDIKKIKDTELPSLANRSNISKSDPWFD